MLRRTAEWFLRLRALRDLRARMSSETAEQRKYRRIARVALELADRAREVLDIGGSSSPLPVQCELYRQTSYWALLSSRRGGGDAVPSFAELWDGPDAVRIRGKLDAGADASLAESLLSPSFTYFALLPLEQQEKRVRELAAFAHALRPAIDDPEEVAEELQQQRLWRIGVPAVIVAVMVLVVAPRIGEWRDERRDVAAGKAWRASSEWFKCIPEEERCDNYRGTRIFFHTREEQSPWLEIDLGKTIPISQVEVTNRSDCCAERAVPLLVEVSRDHKNYRPLARRDAAFDEWLADFPPTEARYVRVKLDGRGILHLERVRVYR